MPGQQTRCLQLKNVYGSMLTASCAHPSIRLHTVYMWYVMPNPVQVYCWPEGTYEGEVVNGRRHGQGVMRLASSEAVYEGSWEDGQRQGQGVLFFDSNRTTYYEGGWQAFACSCADAGHSACRGW